MCLLPVAIIAMPESRTVFFPVLIIRLGLDEILLSSIVGGTTKVAAPAKKIIPSIRSFILNLYSQLMAIVFKVKFLYYLEIDVMSVFLFF